MEEWKEIKVKKNGVLYDYSDKYLVSNNGDIYSIKGKKTLKQVVDRLGYRNIGFGHKKERFKVHQVVAQAFIPNPKGYTEIHHIDGNKENNSVENLKWCDRSFNNSQEDRVLSWKQSMSKRKRAA